MDIFIRTKSGKEYRIKTEYNDIRSFMDRNIHSTSDAQWMNFGKVSKEGLVYDLMIQKKDIEILGFNCDDGFSV